MNLLLFVERVCFSVLLELVKCQEHSTVSRASASGWRAMGSSRLGHTDNVSTCKQTEHHFKVVIDGVKQNANKINTFCHYKGSYEGSIFTSFSCNVGQFNVSLQFSCTCEYMKHYMPCLVTYQLFDSTLITLVSTTEIFNTTHRLETFKVRLVCHSELEMSMFELYMQRGMTHTFSSHRQYFRNH